MSNNNNYGKYSYKYSCAFFHFPSFFTNPDWNNVNREEYDPNSKFYLNYNELIEWEDKRKSEFDLNDDEREFIITGITKETWDQYLKADETKEIVNGILNPERND